MANTKITTRVLTDGAITSAKLADDAVSIAKLDVTDGTNGQVLKTDGNGTLTFTDMTADTDTTYSAGTGLSLTGTTFSSTITQYADSDVGTYLSSNGYATQSTVVAAITDSAPATLDTLNELAAALGDDANFSTTVTNSIALKAPLASPSLTGTVTITGASSDYNTLQLTSNSTGHGTVINLGDTSDVNYGSITQFASSAGEGGRMRFVAGTTETMNLRDGKAGIGTASPATDLHVYHPTSHSEIRVGTSGSSDAKVPAVSFNNTVVEWGIGVKADNHLHIRENTASYASRVTIADGGNVGIGTQAPSEKLHVEGTAKVGSLDVSASIGAMVDFSSTYSYSPNRDWRFITNNFGSTNWGGFSLEKSTEQGGTPSVAMFGIDGAGNMGIGVGGSAGATQPAAKLDVGGTIRTSSGILFGTDTATANRLDDYEEGTFTPVVENGTYTYAQRRGHYTKIGNIVHIHIGLRLASASPNTVGGTISGLPFTSISYGSYQEPHARIGAGGVFVTADLGSHLTFYKGNSNTLLYARTTSTNADSPINSNSIWQAGTFIKLQMSYTVS